MGHTVKRTFELTEEQSRYIDRMVECGAFASADAVVAEAVEALAEEAPELSDWQIKAVLEAIADVEAHPESLKTSDQVWERIKARNGAASARLK